MLVAPLALPLAGCGTWATEAGESFNETINSQDDAVDNPSQKVILKERDN